MKRSLLNSGVPLFVVVLFVITGCAKIFNMSEFRHDTDQFWLMPTWLRTLLPLIVPVAEIWVACLILLPVTRRPAMMCAGLMFIVFAGYHIWNIKYGTAACHCLGGNVWLGLSKKTAGLYMIAFNVMALWLIMEWLLAQRKELYEKATSIHAC